MTELTLMEKFADPALFDTLTLGEKSTGALITTIMGMGITFIVLIFLWGLIAFMAKFTQEKPKPPTGGKMDTTTKAANTATPAAATVMGSSPELIAVITAAIAAFEGQAANAGNLIIRKISRVSGQTTAWGTAGSSDAIGSRKF